MNARIYYLAIDPAERPGWYVELDDGRTLGPLDNAIDAAHAARAEIIAVAEAQEAAP